MATATLLDVDFGSESEDDNFNPAPADVSDNDAAGESDTESVVKRPGGPSDQARRPVPKDGLNELEGGAAGMRQNGEQKSRRSQDETGNVNKEADAQDAAGEYDEDGIGDDDDEEDEEDEDDEDEEAVSVSWVFCGVLEVLYI